MADTDAFRAARAETEATHESEVRTMRTLIGSLLSKELVVHGVPRLFDTLFADRDVRTRLRPFYLPPLPPSNQSDIQHLYDVVAAVATPLLQAINEQAQQKLDDLVEGVLQHFSAVAVKGLVNAAGAVIERDRHETCARLNERIAFLESEYATRTRMIANHEARIMTQSMSAAATSSDALPDVEALRRESRDALGDETLAKMSVSEVKHRLLRSHDRERLAWQHVDALQRSLDVQRRLEEERRDAFQREARDAAAVEVQRAETELLAVQSELNRTRVKDSATQAALRGALDTIRRLDERCVLLCQRITGLVSTAEADGWLSSAMSRVEHVILDIQQATGEAPPPTLERAAAEADSPLGAEAADALMAEVRDLQLKSDARSLPAVPVIVQQQTAAAELIGLADARKAATASASRTAAAERHVTALEEQLLEERNAANQRLRDREMELAVQIDRLSHDNQRLRRRHDQLFVQVGDGMAQPVSGDDVVDDLARRLKERDLELAELRFALAQAHDRGPSRRPSLSKSPGGTAAPEAAEPQPSQPHTEPRVSATSSSSRSAGRQDSATRAPTALDDDWLRDVPLKHRVLANSRPISAQRPSSGAMRPDSAAAVPRLHQLGLYTATDAARRVATPHAAVTPRAAQLKAALAATRGRAPRPPSAGQRLADAVLKPRRAASRPLSAR